jgi:cytochrome c oxidase cbb3-type subunit 1
MVSMGSLYYLVPRLYNTQMYSMKLVEWHFWTATIGVVLYITSMWISGIMQGLMWRAVNSDGTLTYSFVESVQAMHPFYFIRGVGGAVFLLGMVLMAYNIFRTIAQGQAVDAPVLAPTH